MKEIFTPFEQFKIDIGVFRTEYVTLEESKQLLSGARGLPQNVFLDASKAENESRYFQKLPVDCTSEQLEAAFMVWQYHQKLKDSENIKVIKSGVSFLHAAAIIGLIVAVLSMIAPSIFR